MPEFIIPEEADRCPYCGQVLYDPPNCCQRMQDEHVAETLRRANEAEPYYDEDRYDSDGWDESNEPVGSCEWCGVNLYEDDDLENELCEQCSWHAEQNRGGEDSGIQPIV